MAAAAGRRYGNMPQRRATLLPRGSQHSVPKRAALLALETQPTGTGPYLATTAEDLSFTAEQPGNAQFCGMEIYPNCAWLGKAKMATSSPKLPQKHPAPLTTFSVCETEHKLQRSYGYVHYHMYPEANGENKTIAASTKGIRIYPEAQRILGSSCIAVVCLERLRIQMDHNQSISLTAVQPMVSLVRLPCQQPQTEQQTEDAVASPRVVMTPEELAEQRESDQGMEQCGERIEESSGSEPGFSWLGPAETNEYSWTETYPQDRPVLPSPIRQAPEPEIILVLDSESESELEPESDIQSESEWNPGLKSESDSLNPDPEQNMVLELDLDVESESKSKSESNLVSVCEEDSDGRGGDSSPIHGSVVTEEQPQREEEAVEMESEDFCAVCLNGGDLLCCDRCPKVYHLSCHIPPLISFPLGDWVCTLCRSDQEPEVEYICECPSTDHWGAGTPYTLSRLEQRRCEKLTLLLSCNTLSAPFHEPVSMLARHYYQIIKRPTDLSVIRRKLNKRNTLHYFTAEQFVDDVMLMFRNCATFNYPDSEVAHAGRNLEAFFLTKLKEVFPDRAFPMQNQSGVDQARLIWLNRKKENYHRKRKRRHISNGKGYLL